ncbi:hypothetical protein GLA29479_4335 [Lysobacter antibioticus]|jgi:hypothetical protein|uniref:Uncharacterized protein n=1 Tax=Lysobacter antibioticus TaxID=84531 RepID=A0A0S2E2X9_LYSAN|nr:hypothetical protein [Lysobacter antibioticus]ALN65172.1 hypothetical protein GLA29479_4335 [Lysobacter antibioticus]ALN79655.1 hypothetical protein LA76x_1499 [Lysobacter antibioticus]
MSALRRWWLYLLGKRSEVAALDYKDAYMAKVVMDIHRLRSGKAQAMVPLRALQPIHRIDRESALQATHARAQALRARREELLARGRLDLASLNEIIPSVSQIKVVRDGERWLAFEGNGRLYAMREAFGEDSGLTVEVEEYRFDRPHKILRRLRKVRRLNALD